MQKAQVTWRAKEWMKAESVSGIANNARFGASLRTYICRETNREYVSIFATRNIRPDEEIFGSYGNSVTWTYPSSLSETSTEEANDEPDPESDSDSDSESSPDPSDSSEEVEDDASQTGNECSFSFSYSDDSEPESEDSEPESESEENESSGKGKQGNISERVMV